MKSVVVCLTRRLGLNSSWCFGQREALNREVNDRHFAWLEESRGDASASSRHVHRHRALLAECVNCCGGSPRYETTWHGLTDGFRLCWPSWAPSPPSVSWLSPLAPTTGFTPVRTSATPPMRPRTTPRCKPKKSEATWRTPGCGGSAASKVKHSLMT